MDDVHGQAAMAVIADLANTGGGTYERGTLLPFKPDDGYAVGVGGLHLPSDMVTVDAVAWAMKAVGSEFDTSYVGTWLGNGDGLVYFDAVSYYGPDRRAEAIAAGSENGQQAIYDFAAKRSISLITTEDHDR